MKLVYIAGPITKGDLAANINQGTAAFIALAKAGVAAICPMWSAYSGLAMTAAHWHDSGAGRQAVDLRNEGGSVSLSACIFAVAGATPNELSHEDWLKVDFEFIRRCDAVLRLPGESVGADMETAEAGRLGIPVFASVEECLAWASP